MSNKLKKTTPKKTSEKVEEESPKKKLNLSKAKEGTEKTIAREKNLKTAKSQSPTSSPSAKKTATKITKASPAKKKPSKVPSISETSEEEPSSPVKKSPAKGKAETPKKTKEKAETPKKTKEKAETPKKPKEKAETPKKPKEKPEPKPKKSSSKVEISDSEEEVKKTPKKKVTKTKTDKTEKSEKSVEAEEEESPKPKEKITKWIVLSSSVSPELFAAAKALGGTRIEQKVTDSTTHVVISEEGGRTMKVLEGLSRGKFIVTEDWIAESEKEGKWLPEEDYEATKWFPGAKKIRLSHQKKEFLFHELKFYVNPLFSEETVTSTKNIQNMIRRNGGEILLTAEGCDYAIVLRKVASEDKKTQNIKIDWLWDALSTFSLPDPSSKSIYQIQEWVPKVTSKDKKAKKGTTKKKAKEDDDSETGGDSEVSENMSVEKSEKKSPPTKKSTPEKKRDRSAEEENDSGSEDHKTKKKKIEKELFKDLSNSQNLDEDTQ